MADQADKPKLDSFADLLQRAWAVCAKKWLLFVVLALLLSLLGAPTGLSNKTTVTSQDNKYISSTTSFIVNTSNQPISYNLKRVGEITEQTIQYPAWVKVVNPHLNAVTGLWLSEETSLLLQPVVYWLVLTVAIFAILLTILTSILSLITLDQVSLVQTADNWKKSLSLGRVFRYIVTMLLTGVIIFVGFVLLIVPGIIFAIWFSQVSYVFVTEDVSYMRALEKSREYVRGYFWPILWKLVIGTIIVWLVTSVIAWPIAAVFALFGASKLISLGIVALLVGAMINQLGTIFSQSYGYQLFANLKQIKSA